MVAGDSNLNAEELNLTVQYNKCNSGGRHAVLLTKLAADLMLRMRHGTNLVMREMECIASD